VQANDANGKRRQQKFPYFMELPWQVRLVQATDFRLKKVQTSLKICVGSECKFCMDPVNFFAIARWKILILSEKASAILSLFANSTSSPAQANQKTGQSSTSYDGGKFVTPIGGHIGFLRKFILNRVMLFLEVALMFSDINLELRDYFDLKPIGERLEDLDTPVPVIDVDVVVRNLIRWQKKCEDRGISNRPHIKTHKLVGFAQMQLALGAKGITVQKLGEAEVMAARGIDNIFLTFNILGDIKIARLAALMKKATIRVVADNEVVVRALQKAASQSGKKLSVLVECDTGAARNGVQTPAQVLHLVKMIAQAPDLQFAGLMTYPKPGGRLMSARFIDEAKALLKSERLEVAEVSSGGTPDMWSDEGLEDVSEYRAGTYIYGDRSMVVRGICGWEDCALTMLSTVVSTPTKDRALIDAGSKSLTSDLLGLQGYGVVPALGQARVYDLSEEHGFLDTKELTDGLRVGDRVRIVPNHVCPVSNLFDKVVLVRGARVLGEVNVDARGTVQ
jgi:D-serine deaminase-like pyridoxal phosphate-dependent protein